ncbi:hypothetical protein DCO58_04910 [Helicobacter saguini]|uniref:Uncharacterized protein n=1 Tax=Helicobacter saguini TaxID=1548018 RepID=A0A6B0HJ26_9HELI|nr:hypothetical protein [Helicobacter saguini]MWV62310.1 hypothetical protein [Helicobacter saguini]MWV67018.1 hypothetical protein [Helicobacter saguini]MWV69366.1 hypothetical protein [Helicobacter saguini]MWV71078.1 hypothetical protein [Helicobacter saguini]
MLHKDSIKHKNGGGHFTQKRVLGERLGYFLKDLAFRKFAKQKIIESRF